MSDMYHASADAIADQLVGDPDLFDPVSDDFAANSDDGYGVWRAPYVDGRSRDDAGSGAFNVASDAMFDDEFLDRRGRALTDDEQSDLDELNRVRSADGPDQSLLNGSGRGAYVHHDDDDDDDSGVLAPAVAAASTPLPAARKSWWKLSWFDHRRRSHRILAIGAAVLAVLVVVALLLPTGEESATTATTTTPAWSAPTITQSPAGPAEPGQPAADGPIGIKRADSRCTAGSTDPLQAFDSDVNTAWMCVPAYGVPGTVLRVEFDNWYVITGVSIVPGWNRINTDGSDEWLKHMTAAVVEYQFNDPDETRLTQETLNIRDEVITAVQPPVLASAMTITITEFGIPTGAVADTTTIPGQGATIDSQTPITGDLRDFAISTINVVGHLAQ